MFSIRQAELIAKLVDLCDPWRRQNLQELHIKPRRERSGFEHAMKPGSVWWHPRIKRRAQRRGRQLSRNPRNAGVLRDQWSRQNDRMRGERVGAVNGLAQIRIPVAPSRHENPFEELFRAAIWIHYAVVHLEILRRSGLRDRRPNLLKLDIERLDSLAVDVAGGDNGLDVTLPYFESESDVRVQVAERADRRHHHPSSSENVLFHSFLLCVFSTRREDRGPAGGVTYTERYNFEGGWFSFSTYCLF